MTQPAETKPYYAMALDPIHVGTGSYRLGRVDNSIVREPGTNLPKLPGTSLSGACRAYTAMVTGRYNWEEGGKNYSCAGQGQANEKQNKAGHCGRLDCPVCVAFGFAHEGKGRGFHGLAQFSDARLLFFPVHSLAGPVWVTCPAVLRGVGLWDKNTEPGKDKAKLAGGLSDNKRLNLGWLMLSVEEGNFELGTDRPPIPDEVLERTVLASNKLFAQIVNDNLEVRTSVSIDPQTGAAEEGALFTYEAIPRSTVFWFQMTYLEPKFFAIDGKTPSPKPGVRAAVEKGLDQFEHLGIGGMNTRGMGRLRVFSLGKSDETERSATDE